MINEVSVLLNFWWGTPVVFRFVMRFFILIRRTGADFVRNAEWGLGSIRLVWGGFDIKGRLFGRYRVQDVRVGGGIDCAFANLLEGSRRVEFWDT